MVSSVALLVFVVGLTLLLLVILLVFVVRSALLLLVAFNVALLLVSIVMFDVALICVELWVAADAPASAVAMRMVMISHVVLDFAVNMGLVKR